ncbi:Gfo/Idh/MocA family oxidoreductase, partial [bacterium]|nr:Gfo/Idh/MocA family oxidoreductase [bacterium]
AKANRVVLSTYHNRHWDGLILQAVAQIRRKQVIGEVVRVDVNQGGWGKPGDWWRTSKTISGGVVYDWGVHLLEYTLQLVASDVVEVTGFLWRGIWANRTPWKKDTNEDDAFLAVRYASGAWSTLSITTIDARPAKDWFRIIGTKGQYVMNWDAGKIVTHAGARTITTRVPNPQGEGWRLYRNIADHLTKRTRLVISPEWARRPIHILDLAGRSAQQGRALQAKYP